MYQTEFSYDFQGEVKYARDGKEENAHNITVKAPTNSVLSDFAIIDGMVQRADASLVKEQQSLLINMSADKISEIKKMADQFKGQQKEEVKTGTQLVNDLCVGGFDYRAGVQSLMSILVSSKSLIDGVVPITQSIANGISMADTKELLGQYIKIFLLPSRA